MKRFLLSLMVLVMFTPGLACAQFMQHQQSHMAGMAKDMPCCPKPKLPDCAGMLFKDCMKIDLQHTADTLLLKKQVPVKYGFDFATLVISPLAASIVEANAARAPPFERSLGVSQTNLPVFLATQRLRI
jgi:hypothetical protein